MAAFWTDDVWATRFLFGVIFLEFFSGAFFPIDILPNWLVSIFNLTPFPYLIFFPLKIWLEQVDTDQILNIFLISIAWLIIFYILAKLLWRKGVKNYGAYGG
jgi:ABC-2 type transport system permease protein